jgi:hypothetical protein
MSLLNYTTTIEASKTVAEIQRILAAHGAKSILIDYDNDGLIEALSFRVVTPQGDAGIRLPVDPDSVLKVLLREYALGKLRSHQAKPDRKQAVKVAWRIIKDWVEAQMAILETEQVKMEQIFLPYILAKDGRTLYEVALSSHLLTTGEE